jgi:hypothetical protein
MFAASHVQDRKAEQPTAWHATYSMHATYTAYDVYSVAIVQGSRQAGMQARTDCMNAKPGVYPAGMDPWAQGAQYPATAGQKYPHFSYILPACL